jgi:CubicO group peptidase (beta-lactamase class C family)
VKALAALLEQGAADRVFSHARAVVRWRGQVVFDAGAADEGAIFDLASVTKVMSTTALLCRLAARGELDVRAPVASVLPGVATTATFADLAYHRSGLPAFRPFFADVARSSPQLFGSPEPSLRRTIRAEVVERVKQFGAERPMASSAVYSDLGFILLGEAIAAITGEELDVTFEQQIAKPLGLAAGYRRLSSSAPAPATVVSTGGTRPREPAPGQEGQWRCEAWPSAPGQVDDDNAWVMDGVAGHAGLFSTASDVASFGQAVLDGWLTSPLGWELDRTTPHSTRAFGFDRPSEEQASCGDRFGRAGPNGAIGHLGFTGTSLWIDLDRGLVVALLTNRVVYGRANVQIRQFRPRFHDAVLNALGL